MSRPLRVFLCHATQDKPAVWRLHRYLKQHGVQPWLDQEDLLPGQDWQMEIPKAIDVADVIVVCLSKNSVDKEGYVQKEISFALDKALEKPEGAIFIIPAKLEECDIPRRLSRYQWVDLFREDGYQRLGLSLNKRADGLGADAVQGLSVDDQAIFDAEPEQKAGIFLPEHVKKSEKKIFISYKRNVSPDSLVAEAVFEALRRDHDVFMDTTLQVGERWAERIQNAIKESDYLIIFLSAYSVHSEMVIAEIETAHHHGKAHGKPAILPVRLAYEEPLVYPLSAYLNPLQWAFWNLESDTPRLVAELRRAVSGGNLPDDAVEMVMPASAEEEIPTAFANMPRDLGSPEGTMPHQSMFYIERETDREALQALREGDGVTITIKGPRQMGKSSLLNRLMSDKSGRGMKTAFIDFQMIENSVIENADLFYRQFCSLLSWEFEVEDRTEEFWKNPLGQVQKTTNYIQRHLLKELREAHVLLAMDEVERMFTSPFRSDFFSMLRSWHNNRARGGDWTRFNMALVTSTEPYQLIADLNQSPFNVGAVIELKDFTLQQVSDLNRRHGSPLSAEQVAQILGLLGGHPYLTRKALYLVASRRASFEDVMNNCCEDDGPFGDHLRNHLFRMSDHQDLKSSLMQVIDYRRCADEHIFFRLRGAGLVKRVGNEVVPRNELYACYFGERLHG
jgi:hypothetical protein